MGLQLAVNKWINACKVCQQRKNPAGPVRFALQEHCQQQVQRASAVRPCEDLQIVERESLHLGDH